MPERLLSFLPWLADTPISHAKAVLSNCLADCFRWNEMCTAGTICCKFFNSCHLLNSLWFCLIHNSFTEDEEDLSGYTHCLVDALVVSGLENFGSCLVISVCSVEIVSLRTRLLHDLR